MRRLLALIETLSDRAADLAGAASLLLTAIVAAGVVARRVLDAPLLFVDELSGYLVLAIVFLGLAHTMKAGEHIRVEALVMRLGGRARRALEAACLLVALAWSVAVLAGTFRVVAEYYTRQIRSFAYLEVLLWIPGSLMVVGAALLCLQCAAMLAGMGRRRRHVPGTRQP